MLDLESIIKMRKIRKDEIKKVAKLMSSSFVDYPLYSVFFKDDKKKEKRIFYFFYYRIYTRQRFTYISDDETLAVSIKSPTDSMRSALRLCLNPFFFFKFLFTIPLKSLLLVRDYSKMEESIKKKYYDPLNDYYVQAISVLKESRGNGAFLNAFNQIKNERPIYCETHTERNALLYKHMGFKVMEEVNWHGVTHYVLKRPIQLNKRVLE